MPFDGGKSAKHEHGFFGDEFRGHEVQHAQDIQHLHKQILAMVKGGAANGWKQGLVCKDSQRPAEDRPLSSIRSISPERSQPQEPEDGSISSDESGPCAENPVAEQDIIVLLDEPSPEHKRRTEKEISQESAAFKTSKYIPHSNAAARPRTMSIP